MQYGGENVKMAHRFEMGKDKKSRKRLTGLTEDILESKTVKQSGRVKQRRERQGEKDDTVR